MKNLNADLKKVEDFFIRVLDRKVEGAEMQKEGFAFFGVQGSWYTVGYRMVSLIEQTYGRKRLIDVMCDQRLRLTTYNEAAVKYNRDGKEPLALWSESVVKLN